MGAVCAGGDASRTSESANIDKSIKSVCREDRFSLKILILGTTASGKSTITKQMRLLHTDGFSEEEKRNYRTIITLNLFMGMKELVIQAEKFNYKITRKNKKIAKFFAESNPYSPEELSPDLVEKAKALWEDKGIVKTFERRHEFDLSPNTVYCMNNIGRIASPEYDPTNEDVLHARQRTTGIVETKFKKDKYKWTIIDVGGQRTERRKWINCFDSVNAVIYVASLDEFNIVNQEDTTMTRMEESLHVFEQMLNLSAFKDTCTLLFLNKTDLFREKIQTVNMSDTFPDYTGGTDYTEGVNYIKQKYLSRLSPQKVENMWVHETCAIDTQQIGVIFDAVMETIFKERLRASGL